MTVDFFAHEALPAPQISDDEARRIAASLGVPGGVEALGSQQDANFLVRAEGGTVLAVLKIANPAFTAAEVEAQDEAADAIAAARPELRVATVLRREDGSRRAAVVETASGPVVARLLRHLPGGTLTGPRYLAPRAVAAMGRIAGRVSATLRDFAHPGLDRVLQWDLQHADRVLALLLPHVGDPAQRAAVAAAAEEAWRTLDSLRAQLPRQAVHMDLTDDNLVAAVGPVPLPDGVIDFGDVATSWAVAELAIPLSSLLHHDGMEPHAVVPAVAAFHAERPLSAAEARALWPLVVLRAATLVASGRQQAAIDGESNAYARAALDREWRIFEQAVSVPTQVMTGLFLDRLGLAEEPPHVVTGVSLVADLKAADVAPLDLTADANAMDHGAWLAADVEERLARELIADGAAAVLAPYGQARLSRSRVLSAASPATVATGVELRFGRDAVLQAPLDGRVLRVGPGRIDLSCGSLTLRLTGDEVRPEAVADVRVRTGQRLFALPAGALVHIALLRADAPDAPEVPELVRPEYAPGWLALTADPAPLLGLPSGQQADEADLLARRGASFASVQGHYYDEPPRIERGWRHHLVDDRGRAYLDIVNNVSAIGHAHPAVERAVSRQLRRLNTNSRFHYGAVVEFTERLTALLPAPLDTVFLVNSGSEAVDLGIRLAIGATGQEDVVALREAYHGWTYASDAVSTSLQDNPNALETRPGWVHTVDSPNSYRGRHRGADAACYAPEAVAVIDELAAAGRAPGAFLGETWYGNAGGVALPDGYLEQVYAAVRRHGGLAVADEVQVGYGRLGHWFWGFEQQGVVPDIVCVAKAMGNGHPLGAVITSREVAERYRDQGYFFSSTGGSPVSCVVGSTVLDVLRDEDLQGNAVRTGARLKAGLEALGERHPLVGAVHGSGLYLGLELVRDRTTLEPATEETAELCDRMLDLGVVVQPTGDHLNVLKIKPPLCIDTEAADFFTAMLDRALGELRR